MQNRFDLFERVLHRLAKEDVLKSLILIGGWCQHIYRIHYDNTPYISGLRTLDIDFLIPRPFRVSLEKNVDEMLLDIGFNREYSTLSGCQKYVHPELEVEFLTPETGRGSSKPLQIRSLHLSAQRLRYINMLQQNDIQVDYKGMLIRVPHPAAYVLHKFILYKKRKNPAKREKDLKAAVEIGEFLLRLNSEKERMLDIYAHLPQSWQTIIARVMKISSEKLYSEIIAAGAKTSTTF